jgi:phosphoribosyl 1,2-cyclic phosphate phosphodiesterase
MRITLLGTGGSAGVPLIGGADGAGDWGACDPTEPRNQRTRASIVAESAEGGRLLVDTGPDLRAQLLACRIPLVDAVLYTHPHADHITGIDEVRILNRLVNRPLDAFATHATLDELTHRFGYAFRPWQPPHFYRPVLVAREVAAGDTIEAAGMPVRLFAQDHGRIESLGLRIGAFAYSTDVVALNDAAFEALAGVDTWVVGCFLRQGPHSTHADLATVLQWIARVRPRRAVLTHMGTDMDWAWLARHLPEGVEAGYDGMVLEVAPDAAAGAAVAAGPAAPG